MSSTFTFVKRGTNSTENLLPTGFVEQGINGNKGSDGVSGSSLYFIDYDPSNSYYKELVQKRLESNYILSSNNSTKLSSRTYRTGDIIMANNKNMYRVIDAESDSKYKFDIEYVGTIVTDEAQAEDNFSDVFVDVELVGYDSSIKDCIVPTNRSMDFDGSIYAEFRVMNWFEQHVRSEDVSPGPKLEIHIQDAAYTLKKTDSSGNAIYPSLTLDNVTTYSSIWNANILTERICAAINNFIDSSLDSSDDKYAHFHGKFVYANNKIYTDCGKKYISMTFGCGATEYESHFGFDGLYFYSNNEIGFGDNVNEYYTDLPKFIDARDLDCNELYSELYSKYPGLTESKLTYQVSTTYDKAFRKLYGLTFKPCIRFSITDSKSSVYTDYDYYLKIYLKNTKTLQCGDFSLATGVSDDFTPSSPSDPAKQELNGNFTFYKPLEFKLTKLGPDSANPYINPTDSNDYVNRVFISDQSADKLHPSGNNIRINCTSYKNKSITKKREWANIEYLTTTGNIAWVDPYRINFSSNSTYYSTFGDYYFSRYPYQRTHSFVQYSKRNDEDPCPINFRGGESAYFSGMTVPSFTKQYVTKMSLKTGNKHPDAPIGKWDTQYSDETFKNLYNNLNTYKNSSFDNYAANILSLNENCDVFGDYYWNNYISYDTTGIDSLWINGARIRNEIVSDYVTHKMAEFLFSDENKYEIVAIKRRKTKDNTKVGVSVPIIIMPISVDKIYKQKTL
jgi:hypothetical protein